MTTRVKCMVGTTIALGDFEFMRIDLGIEDDKRPDETAGMAMDRIFNFIAKRVEEKAAETYAELKKAKNSGGY